MKPSTGLPLRGSGAAARRAWHRARRRPVRPRS